jgi:hypothetical protein
VLQLRVRPGLAQQPRAEVRVEAGAQQLDRGLATEGEIVGEEDLARVSR